MSLRGRYCERLTDRGLLLLALGEGGASVGDGGGSGVLLVTEAARLGRAGFSENGAVCVTAPSVASAADSGGGGGGGGVAAAADPDASSSSLPLSPPPPPLQSLSSSLILAFRPAQAKSGARLRYFDASNCPNITAIGVVAIIKASARHLRYNAITTSRARACEHSAH